MTRRKHCTLDVLASFAFGLLGEREQQQVAEHLAEGCVDCRRDLGWIEYVTALARSDQSTAPPAPVLARALRIFPRAPINAPAADTLWGRIRALTLFDSLDLKAVAGVRGTMGATRQVLYRVSDVHLEIAVRVQRPTDGAQHLDLRGQVFALDEDVDGVAGLPVSVVMASGRQETITSSLGEFHLTVPVDAHLLLLRAKGREIEVAVPKP